MTSCRIGCAGWSLPKSFSAAFPRDGSHLERYSSVFDCVEINSSFYRSHMPQTYARWSASVPARFRFSVKLPRAITHEARLKSPGKLLDRFFGEVEPLGKKLGCVLVQLPPSLAFDRAVVHRALKAIRARTDKSIVVEPRHATWFATDANEMLTEYAIGRVAADPAMVPLAAQPGGDPAFVYFRWHGSPKIYYSNYDAARLRSLAKDLRNAQKSAREVWCVFDNTTLGFATGNALELRRYMRRA
ncbi:MAG: DUF72 domain-containing protein [Rudaea sp.]